MSHCASKAGAQPTGRVLQNRRIRVKTSPAAPAVPTRPTPSQTLAASAAGSTWAVISCRLRAAPPSAWGTPMRDAAVGPAGLADGDGAPSGPTAGWSAAGVSAPSAPAIPAASPDGAVPAAGCPAPGCWSGAAVPAGAGGVVVAAPVAAAPVAGAGVGEVGTVVVGTEVVGDGETVLASGTGVGCGEAGTVPPSRP